METVRDIAKINFILVSSVWKPCETVEQIKAHEALVWKIPFGNFILDCRWSAPQKIWSHVLALAYVVVALVVVFAVSFVETE